MATAQTSASSAPALDTTRKFVRKTGVRGNGFIEFEFAIGEPEIFVEMILGPEAFADFCSINQVEMLPEGREPSASSDDFTWRLSDATSTRFK